MEYIQTRPFARNYRKRHTLQGTEFGIKVARPRGSPENSRSPRPVRYRIIIDSKDRQRCPKGIPRAHSQVPREKARKLARGAVARVKSVKVGRGKDFHGNVETLRVFLLAPPRWQGFPAPRFRSFVVEARGAEGSRSWKKGQSGRKGGEEGGEGEEAGEREKGSFEGQSERGWLARVREADRGQTDGLYVHGDS